MSSSAFECHLGYASTLYLRKETIARLIATDFVLGNDDSSPIALHPCKFGTPPISPYESAGHE